MRIVKFASVFRAVWNIKLVQILRAEGMASFGKLKTAQRGFCQGMHASLAQCEALRYFVEEMQSVTAHRCFCVRLLSRNLLHRHESGQLAQFRSNRPYSLANRRQGRGPKPPPLGNTLEEQHASSGAVANATGASAGGILQD